jgi:serine-type D-Ala-D-Ala carboxypeptidase/endopeptidase (penicillin-binding protein 4)
MRIGKLLIASALVLAMANPLAANAASTCRVTKELSSKSLLELHAEVVNATTGQVLFSKAADTPIRTASVLKLLTATVALDVLGPDYRVTTRVYQDPEDQGKIYLVGAGDVTLSRMPSEVTSYYANGPKLDDLSQQIAAYASERGFAVTSVVVDSTLYGSHNDWHSSWSKLGLSQGYMAPVSALQIDAGRLTNSKNIFIAKRTKNPITQAGSLFVYSLKKSGLAQGVKAVVGKMPAGSVQIASVQSRPISEWVENMLRVSDNSLAEALGRLSSLALGFDGSMESLTSVYQKVLAERGLDVSTIKIVDGSGLSALNQVPAGIFTELLSQIYQNPEAANIVTGMPVAGARGSLHYRFTSGYKKAAIGKVIAKTGYIHTGYSMAGFVKAKDGTDLIFSVFNLGKKVRSSNRVAMDNLVFGFYRCGARLTQ